MVLTDAAFLFILAHEFAHITLNHFEKYNSLKYNNQAEGINEIQKDMEIEADLWAVDKLKEIYDDGNYEILAIFSLIPQLYFGVDLCISQFHKPKSKLGNILNDSHPHSFDRIFKAREI